MSGRQSNCLWNILAILYVGAATTAPALAQDASGANGTDPAAASTKQPALTNEIIITATKREQRLQDVPVSITAISGAQLQEKQISDLRNLQGYVPNMAILNSGVNPVVYIRGFGSGPNNVAFDQEVSVYLDGIYGGRGAQFTAPFFDVERIEVLRGPQGALFGRNTAAGAISIISAKPTRDFQGLVSGAYNFDRKGYETTAIFSGPLTSTLGARFAGKLVREHGFLKNLATGRNDPKLDEELARLTLRWRPSGADVTLKGEYGRHQYWGGVTESGSLTQPTQFTDEHYVSDPYGPLPEPEQSGIKSANVVLTANIFLGDHTLTSITGWSHFTTKRLTAYDELNPDHSIPATGANARFANGFPEHFDQYSQELRLASPAGKSVEYVVGAYYDWADYHLHQDSYYQHLLGGAVTGHQSTDFFQKSHSVSIFGQGTLRFTKQFRAIAGLRYSNSSKTGDFSSRTVSGVRLNAIGPNLSSYLSEHYLDPSFTLQYDAAHDVMVYATVARGSKSGGFVSNTYNVQPAGFQFKPERSTNYEAGVKSKIGGRATLNLSVFLTKFTDLQQSAYDPDRRTFFTRNAAKASSRGAEAELQWFLTKNFEVNSSIAYLDAKFDDYPGAPCLAYETLAQCNSANPASISQHNIAGLPLLFAPKWSGNLGGRLTQDISNNLTLVGSVNGLFRSKYYVADGYSPIWGLQHGWLKLDGRVQVGARDDRWNVALVGRNITNRKTVGAAIRLPGSITGVTRSINWMDEYRSLAVEGTLRF